MDANEPMQVDTIPPVEMEVTRELGSLKGQKALGIVDCRHLPPRMVTNS